MKQALFSWRRHVTAPFSLRRRRGAHVKSGHAASVPSLVPGIKSHEGVVIFVICVAYLQ
jgi:hypothetical protein